MSNPPTDSKLGTLVEILKKCEKPEGIEADDTIALKVVDPLTLDELGYLNQSPLAISHAISAKGTSVKVSEFNSALSGSLLKIRVPRDRRRLLVASCFDDFLEAGSALINEPTEYIILEESFEAQPFQSAIDSGDMPERVRSYRTTREVVDLLRTEADHTSVDDKTFSFFDAERIDIVVSECSQVLSSDFPVLELKAFLSESGMQTLRKEAFKTTLWDTLKDYSTAERFRRLIEKGRGASFMRAVQYNFRLAKSDYTLGKRLESARQEYRELAGNLAKLASGLEAKAFVLPGTLLLAGRFISLGDGVTFSNTVISLSTVALAIISTVAYKAHSDISRDFEEEIEKARSNLSDTHEDQLIRTRLNRLSGRFERIQKIKLAITIGSWLVALAIVIACVWPSKAESNDKNQKSDPSVSIIPASAPKEPSNSPRAVGSGSNTANLIDKSPDSGARSALPPTSDSIKEEARQEPSELKESSAE